MASVTLKGNPAALTGELPQVGDQAPDFRFVQQDLSEATLSEVKGKATIIIGLPSLDTGVCQTETRRFNKEIAMMQGVKGLVVSKDLPFAMSRFCANEGIEEVISASDFRYNEFNKLYNTEITEGPFKGLSARAVFVIDEDMKIQYTELVPEIADEPQYDQALEAVKKIIG